MKVCLQQFATTTVFKMNYTKNEKTDIEIHIMEYQVK